MGKRIASIILAIMLALLLLTACGAPEHIHSGGEAGCEAQAVCSECGEAYGEVTGHSFGSGYEYNEEKHWQECENGCGKRNSEAAHSFGDWASTDSSEGEVISSRSCSVCGYTESKTEEIPHSHDFGYEWQSDGNNHWQECTCGEKQGLASHSGTAVCGEMAICETCGESYGEKKEHSFLGEYKFDELKHWHTCDYGCGEVSGEAAHEGGTATEEQRARCSVCNAPYGELKQPLITWQTQALTPAVGAKVDLANSHVLTWVKEYSYLTTDTNSVALGVDCFAPEAVIFTWQVGEDALYHKLYLSRQEDMKNAECYLVAYPTLTLDFLHTGSDYYWYVDSVYSTYTVRSEVFSFSTAYSPRTVNVEGVSNVRDIGGYITEDGAYRIKEGMVYRSAKLDDVTELGKYTLQYLLGIRTDLDLRGEKDGTRPLGEEVGYVNVAAPHYSGSSGIWASETTKAEFAKAIKVFADIDNYPIIFHCALGRDRTGTLALVLEGLLGLDVNTLIMEYELSAFSFQGCLGSTSYSSLRGQIVETYNYINNNYEGESFSQRVADFLLEIGVTAEEIAAIREIMLEEVEK